MKNKPARKHHTGKQWEAKPQSVAYQKDFYRVDIADGEPDDFEKALAQFETIAARNIMKLAEQR